MLITRTSMFTGKVRTLDLDVTPEQFAAWEGGELIQRAFPNLTADEREFILTGATEGEWEEQWNDGSDDYDLSEWEDDDAPAF